MSTRREALWILGAAAGAEATVFPFPQSNQSPTFPERFPLPKTEQRQYLQRIRSHMDVLCFAEMPAGIRDAQRDKRESWSYPRTEFENHLPDYIYPWGERTKRVALEMLGPDGTRIVKGAVPEYTLPDRNMFDTVARQVNVATDISAQYPFAKGDDPRNIYSVGVNTHEITHGTDPDSMKPMIYPWSILLAAEDGKWMAVKEVFRDPKCFSLINSGLYNLSFKQGLGSIVGLAHRAGELTYKVLKGKDKPLHRAIDSLTQDKIDPGELRFNRRISEALGKVFMELMFSGAIAPTEKFQADYQTVAEDHLSEIFAEMGRLNLSGKERFTRVTEYGVQKVYSAVHGHSVNMHDLRARIQDMDPELVARQAQFDKAFKLAKTRSEEASRSDEEAMRKVLDQKKDLEAFYRGRLPQGIDLDEDRGDNSDIRFWVQQYSDLAALYTKSYPALSNDRSAPVFDPNIDIADIQKIEAALDYGFVNSLIMKIKEGKQDEINLAGLFFQRNLPLMQYARTLGLERKDTYAFYINYYNSTETSTDK